MAEKVNLKLILYGIALAMAVATIVLSYTGLPGTYDTEPMTGIGIFALALAGLSSIKDK